MNAPGDAVRRGAAEVPAPVLDALLGAAVVIVIAIGVATNLTSPTGPTVGAYLFAVFFGALLMFRRRFPLPVLIITALGMCVYYTLDYPAIGLALPMAAALYSAAEKDLSLAAALTGLAMIILSIVFQLRDGRNPVELFGLELLSTAALMAAAIALGDGTRSRRELRRLGELREREARAQAERERADERLALSRELHDDLGHSLSVIALHAASAEEAVTDDPEAARGSLHNVRQAATEALRQLRGTVKVLRRTDEPVPTAPEATLAELDRIAATLREAGIDVTQRISAPELPGGVSAVAYRIVQEATTNVIKHAQARHVTIDVHTDGPVLRIEVSDDGVGAGGSQAGRDFRAGQGIRGMAERASALGGTVGVRSESAGTTVSASLPLDEEGP
ncbi:histidine kinase [Microlunatus parietis]|uniref:histidine kinase n=1 Tax=Microlunatus parietis TaxID=682979 RepID=A0A7Y9I5Z6_9ACTN|nr:sensor histidine kinase [Microlunatus parietis]NYE70908.1 signal transduction histidine kinase [Microlunatus parietis]